jgi:4'-phosphopantetheinyl transferase
MKYSFALLSDFSAEELSLTEKMLSESEKLRLSAKPREKYVQSLAVRTLLKKLLDKSGIYMTDFCVDRATCGKPLLISPEGLYISFSHSEDMVACVFSDRPVGIDIQKIKKCSTKTVERICTAAEKQFIEREGPNFFYTFWTLKEAYLKASGCSFAEMLNTSFAVSEKITVPDDGYRIEYGNIDDYAWAVVEI